MPPSRWIAPENRVVAAIAWLVALALAMAGRHVTLANTDVSWLLTLDGKWLDGARPYVDIVETNPPMSLYLYMPVVLLGRWTSIAPERLLDALVLALAFVSLTWSGRRAAPVIFATQAPPAWLAPVAYAALVVMPAFCLGQREHFALLAFLPWLATALRRADRRQIGGDEVFVAGVAAGLVMAIKPHFALPVLLAGLVAAGHARAWRVVFAPENFIAAAGLVAYVAITFIAHPAFWNDIAPMLARVYVPVRVPVWRLIFGDFPVFTLEMAVAAALVWRLRGRAAGAPWLLVSLAAIVGFILAAVIQAKGFPYHFLPAFGLITLALLALGARDPATGRPDKIILLIALAFSAQVWRWCDIGVDLSPLRDKVAALKANPRLISLAADPTVGFPLTREVDGVWVDRAESRWIPYYAGGLAAAGADAETINVLRAIVEKDRRGFAADTRARRPDIILMERRPFDYLDWARRDTELADLLTCFARADGLTVGDPDAPGGRGLEVEIWTARVPVPAAGGCDATRAIPAPP